jgi:hypothetical protein
MSNRKQIVPAKIQIYGPVISENKVEMWIVLQMTHTNWSGSRDRKYVLCMRNRFPGFFLTIVVVQNVPLRMTRSSMATGCDVNKVEMWIVLQMTHTNWSGKDLHGLCRL